MALRGAGAGQAHGRAGFHGEELLVLYKHLKKSKISIKITVQNNTIVRLIFFNLLP